MGSNKRPRDGEGDGGKVAEAKRHRALSSSSDATAATAAAAVGAPSENGLSFLNLKVPLPPGADPAALASTLTAMLQQLQQQQPRPQQPQPPSSAAAAASSDDEDEDDDDDEDEGSKPRRASPTAKTPDDALLSILWSSTATPASVASAAPVVEKGDARRSRSESEYRGVYRRSNGRWTVQVWVPTFFRSACLPSLRTTFYAGDLSDEREAAALFDVATIRMRGPAAASSALNFPLSDYLDEEGRWRVVHPPPRTAGLAAATEALVRARAAMMVAEDDGEGGEEET